MKEKFRVLVFLSLSQRASERGEFRNFRKDACNSQAPWSVVQNSKTQFHLLSLFFITNSIFAHTRSIMQSIQHFSFVIYSPLFWSLIFSVANSGSNERAFWLFYRGRDGDQSTTVDMVKRSTLSCPLRHISGGSCM